MKRSKEPLDEGERESEKVGLKLSIQKPKIMASVSIISWQIDGGNMETVTDFISWAPKSMQMMSAAMKLKDLLLGRNAMTHLESVLKSRDITLPTKVRTVKAMVFPVFMYRCES